MRPNDLGGVPGFGAVEIEAEEPAFHHEWERRAFAITLATNYFGLWNVDQNRAVREHMSRDRYVATSYYEIWLQGLEHLLNARGLVTREELAARRRDPSVAITPSAGIRVLAAGEVERTLSDPRASRLDVEVPAHFVVGQSVITRKSTPAGHTRLPQYARGRRGVVTADHGVWIFADAAGQDRGYVPEHVYTVRFTATELWGDAANACDTVYVDLWDDHLEVA
jgi:nitrile hydratase beta subunit